MTDVNEVVAKWASHYRQGKVLAELSHFAFSFYC